MFSEEKSRARRSLVREDRLNARKIWETIRAPQIIYAIVIASVFCISLSALLHLRMHMVRVRPDKIAPHDISSRVSFSLINLQRVAELKQKAIDAAPRVYRTDPDCFTPLDRILLALPEEVAGKPADQLPADLSLALDIGAITQLKQIAADPALLDDYRKWTQSYIDQLKKTRDAGSLVVLEAEERTKILATPGAMIKIISADSEFILDPRRTFPKTPNQRPTDIQQRDDLLKIIAPLASRNFIAPLSANIAALSVNLIPLTYKYDPAAYEQEQRLAEQHVDLSPAKQQYTELSKLAERGAPITPERWTLLSEEQAKYVHHLKTHQPFKWYGSILGAFGLSLLMTVCLSAYIAAFQPRVVRNKFRGIAIGALLLGVISACQSAGQSGLPLEFFAAAPTLLAAMILAIAYDQRFAMGISLLLAVMATLGLSQSAGFFIILLCGILAAVFLLDDVRKRSKLVIVGAAAGAAMALMSLALDAIDLQPKDILFRDALYYLVAGLATGFAVLGILPFIEKAFKITTSMTLLELADASHPLLKKLQIESPGTYNHSLQVASIAEAAAESIGANALLCRVGSYYHDVGKTRKADYFYENQFGGPNRHINLSPSVSLLIIIGHVKDGVEMAREYRLPPPIHQIIQQHHGTTLIEFFLHKARKQNESKGGDEDNVQEEQFRYPGPKPRSREAVIVMVSDAAESASRTLSDFVPSRVEGLVHDLVMQRLLDGQFDECEMTFGELDQVEKAVVKGILSIHHARPKYPDQQEPETDSPAIKSA